jgi:hypothetical protein
VFSEVPEGEVSALLQSLLQVYVPLALAIHTEKARSEFMIAPLLAEVLTHAPCPVSLFSGVDFADVPCHMGITLPVSSAAAPIPWSRGSAIRTTQSRFLLADGWPLRPHEKRLPPALVLRQSD